MHPELACDFKDEKTGMFAMTDNYKSQTNQDSASQETATNAFDFYNAYLSVIYGLVATLGLTGILAFTQGEEETWNVVSISLFAGTFITVGRLWLSLANIDAVSRSAYSVTARSECRMFTFRLLVDSVFATVFAGLLLAMFPAAPAVPSEASEFRLFLWLAGLNLGYAVLSGSLFYGFSKFSKAAHQEAADQETIRRYNREN